MRGDNLSLHLMRNHGRGQWFKSRSDPKSLSLRHLGCLMTFCTYIAAIVIVRTINSQEKKHILPCQYIKCLNRLSRVKSRFLFCCPELPEVTFLAGIGLGLCNIRQLADHACEHPGTRAHVRTHTYTQKLTKDAQ